MDVSVLGQFYQDRLEWVGGGGGGCEYSSEPSGSIRGGGEFHEELEEKY
jgi:hypothetical protein